jgi:hypothetical protein
MKEMLKIAPLLIALGLLLYVHLEFLQYPASEEDIYFIYLEGERILDLESPYSRTLEAGMRTNRKLATYFPGMYYFGALMQKFGLSDFGDWLRAWRWILFFTLVQGACLLFFFLKDRVGWIFAYALIGIWLFNRWTLHNFSIAHVDIPAVFFLVLSLMLLKKHFKWALVCVGVSLAIKQIAIFLVPLFLIWAWHRRKSIRDFLENVIWLALLPVILSLPFLLSQPLAFLRSVLFSATRSAESHFSARSLDWILGWTGMPAKIPMLLLMLLIYFVAWKKASPPPAVFCFLVLLLFVNFNSVLFTQYMVWPIALVPLLFVDWPTSDQRLSLQ